MLVLTRKLMEKLYIGEDICVTVVRLEGGQVRLGIEAPREVSVVRAELVPERCNMSPRCGQRAAGPASLADCAPPPGRPAETADLGRAEPGVRIPQASAHGNGIRRRGPSR